MMYVCTCTWAGLYTRTRTLVSSKNLSCRFWHARENMLYPPPPPPPHHHPPGPGRVVLCRTPQAYTLGLSKFMPCHMQPSVVVKTRHNSGIMPHVATDDSFQTRTVANYFQFLMIKTILRILYQIITKSVHNIFSSFIFNSFTSAT